MEQDFSKGFHVTNLEEEFQEIAEEINAYMREISNNRKKGKANTARFALKLAMSELERRREDKGRYEQELQKIREQEMREIKSL